MWGTENEKMREMKNMGEIAKERELKKERKRNINITYNFFYLEQNDIVLIYEFKWHLTIIPFLQMDGMTKIGKMFNVKN